MGHLTHSLFLFKLKAIFTIYSTGFVLVSVILKFYIRFLFDSLFCNAEWHNYYMQVQPILEKYEEKFFTNKNVFGICNTTALLCLQHILYLVSYLFIPCLVVHPLIFTNIYTYTCLYTDMILVGYLHVSQCFS